MMDSVWGKMLNSFQHSNTTHFPDRKAEVSEQEIIAQEVTGLQQEALQWWCLCKPGEWVLMWKRHRENSKRISWMLLANMVLIREPTIPTVSPQYLFNCIKSLSWVFVNIFDFFLSFFFMKSSCSAAELCWGKNTSNSCPQLLVLGEWIDL